MSEERIVPRKAQDSFLHHGALNVVVHEHHILLQGFHGKVETRPLQLCQHHL